MTGLVRLFIISLFYTGAAGLLTGANAQFVPSPDHHYYETGVRLYEEGLYRQAADHFRKFLDIEPDRIVGEEAYYYMTLAEIALDSVNYEVYANRFLKRYPAGLHAAALLDDMAGRNYHDGDFEKALETYARAFEIETDEDQKAMFLFWMAESAREMEKPDSASTLYHKLAETFPRTDWAPKALYARGRLYVVQEEYDQSAAIFEELRERYPNYPVTRQIGTVLGEVYYRRERYEEAIRALTSELPHLQDEALLKAFLLIAESHNYLGQFDRASEEYRRYINLSDDEIQARPAHYGLGWVYHKQQVYHWAANAFGEAALGDDELTRKALYYKAINWKLSGRYDRALEVFQEFGDRYQEGFWVQRVYYEWAVTAFELGRYDLAIEVLQQLVRADFELNEPGKIYSLLGEAYFANDEFARALQAFDMAQETTGVDSDIKRQARFQRAWVLYENRAYSEARGIFESVYREQPGGELAAEALFWSADCYYNLGQWRDAAQQFERFLEGYPGHQLTGAAVYSLGWAYFNMRDFELAIRHFESFDREHESPPMALFPYDVDARLRLGDSHYALSRYEDAIQYYKEVAGADPGGDYAIFQMGNSYFRDDQSFEAVRNFRSLIRTYPDSRLREQAKYNVGYIYFLVGNYDQAIEEFHELINRYPDTEWAARAQYQIGDAFYNAADYENAIEAYRIILDEYPHSDYVVDAVNGIQFAQLAAGKEDTSLEILENFLNQHPQTGTADQLRYRVAENLKQAGDYREAVASFRHYIRVTTSERMIPEAWYNIGESYEQLNEYESAIASYHEIVENYPGSDRVDHALLNIGRVRYEQGNYAESIEVLEQLVEREGRLHAEALTVLGDASLAAGRLGQADAAFNEALQRREDYEPSLIGRGKVALERGQYMDAERFFGRVSEINTMERGAEAQYYLGVLEQARRNHEEAIEAFAKVSALYETYDEWVAKAMFATAESYRQLGQPGRAQRALRDIIERFPDSEFAEEAAEQL